MGTRLLPYRAALAVGAVLVAGVIAGCAAQPAGSGGIAVSGAWARNSPAVATAGAVYMQIANGGGAEDVLTGAAVDPSVAAMVEIHETVAADSGMGTGSEPMMEMRPVDRIVIPPGGTVALEPGGYHIMLMNLASPLETGGQVALTLTFERAGQVAVTADVREMAP